jgi:hypothetical protein
MRVANISRRGFLGLLGGATLLGGTAREALSAAAHTERIPIGLELYTVDAAMKADFAGTLRRIAALGYREVEFPWYYGHSAADVVKAL